MLLAAASLFFSKQLNKVWFFYETYFQMNFKTLTNFYTAETIHKIFETNSSSHVK